MKRIITGTIALVVIIFLGVFAIPTNPAKETNTGNTLKVTTSFYPLFFFTQELGGDKVSVTNLTRGGTEPHEYELTAQDTVAILESDLLVIQGKNFEPWGDKIEENLDRDTLRIVRTGENLGDGTDPHIWLSPWLVGEIAEEITQALISTDPANKSYYETRAKTFQEKLTALHEEFQSGLKSCKTRNFVTSHDAFGYLAKDYSLTQTPIAGLSPEAEPSPKELGEIAKFLKDSKINYVFLETLGESRLANTLAQEVGAEILTLDPLEGVSKENQAAGKNYFTVMRENLKNLKTALECQTQ